MQVQNRYSTRVVIKEVSGSVPRSPSKEVFTDRLVLVLLLLFFFCYIRIITTKDLFFFLISKPELHSPEKIDFFALSGTI